MIQSSTSPCLDDDVWDAGGGIERFGLLAFDGDVKGCGAIGIVGIEKFFREIEFADANGSDVAQPWFAWVAEAAGATPRVSSEVRAHLRRL